MFDNNFFFVNKEPNPESLLKPRKMILIEGMIFTFIGWNITSLFINLNWVSLILLPCILDCGMWLTKRKWIQRCDKYNKYNRIFILKHGTYIIGYAFYVHFYWS